jgi:hypothetical protein
VFFSLSRDKFVELSVVRQGLVRRSLQGVRHSPTPRRAHHSRSYSDMISGRRRQSRSRSLTSRAPRMRSRISNKKFKYYLKWILPTSQSMSLCFTVSGRGVYFRRYHGSYLKGSHLWIVMEYACTPGNFLQPFDRLFFRYCSGGSCSDLVGLLLTYSLSRPKSFRR